MKFLRFAVPLALVLFVGVGTSFAAENALPGDPLYPIKVSVNEKVASALTFSASGKTELDARIAAKRLSEANQLAAEGRLSSSTAVALKESFQEAADRAESRIEALRAAGDVDGAERISSDFAATLAAHDRALTAIALRLEGKGKASAALSAAALAPAAGLTAATNADVEGQASGTVSAREASDNEDVRAIQELTLPIRAALKAVSDDHKDAQDELSSGTQAATATVADRKISLAAQLIASGRDTLSSKNAQLSTAVSAKASAELDQADQLLTQARAQLAAQAAPQAIMLANHAAQVANQVNILLNLQLSIGSSAKLNIPEVDREDNGAAGTSSASENEGRDDRGGLNLFNDDHEEEGLRIGL